MQQNSIDAYNLLMNHLGMLALYECAQSVFVFISRTKARYQRIDCGPFLVTVNKNTIKTLETGLLVHSFAPNLHKIINSIKI